MTIETKATKFLQLEVLIAEIDRFGLLIRSKGRRTALFLKTHVQDYNNYFIILKQNSFQGQIPLLFNMDHKVSSSFLLLNINYIIWFIRRSMRYKQLQSIALLQKSMIQEGEADFVALIKIRIGEPLTAVQVDKSKVIFGSISGYVGYYDLEARKTNYFQPINDQIIRGIYSKDSKLYIAVGDRSVLIKDMRQGKDEQIRIVRSHSNNICSHTMTMMYQLKEVIFCAFPTQKRESIPTELEQEKNNLYEIDIDKNEVRTHRQFKIPQIYVPFDFDGNRILWMEYKENGVKEFQSYDLNKKQFSTIKNFGNQYHFLSFGKILSQQIIFIENNKNIKLLNTENNSVMDLYSHSSSVIAFDVAEREEKYFRLVSVDFNGIYKQWKNNFVIKSVNLWSCKNVPQSIRKHQYLFDMGYPYYLKVFQNTVAITTDLGLCIFKI